jgi:hypothetical protein
LADLATYERPLAGNDVLAQTLPLLVNTLPLEPTAYVIELIADTRLALAVVLKLDRTPNVMFMLEKLLSTSELVRGVPFTVAPV